MVSFLLVHAAALQVSAAGCDPPPSGLLDWWPGDGNAKDIAGTNNGILVANATANAPGIVGSAFHFDGTNDCVQIPDSPNFHLTNFTLELWVRFDALNTPSDGPTPGQQYIVFKQNSQTAYFEGFALIKDRTISAGGDASSPVNGDIFLFMASSGTNTVEAEGITLVTTGVWYHVAAVRGPDFLQLYVNGNLDAQTSVNFPQNYGTLPLYFGSSGESFWDCKLGGSVDEVSLYNRVLSADEIAAVYRAGSSGKCKPPSILGVGLHSGHSGVTFAGSVGQIYGVQSTTNLLNGNSWRGLTNLTLTVPTNLWLDPQPATQPEYFYRIVTGPISIR